MDDPRHHHPTPSSSTSQLVAYQSVGGVLLISRLIITVVQKDGLVHLIFIMSSNPICIDSPFFRVPPPFYPIKPDAEPEPENADLQSFPFGAASPEILPPAFRPSSSVPMTPWSALLHSQLRQKPAELILPPVFAYEGQGTEGIDQRISYSEGEEECGLMTPVKQHQGSMEDELSSLELLTTSRKPSFEPLQIPRTGRMMKMGLKKLTHRVFGIVSTLRNATYKDVADRLVREVQFEEGEFDPTDCQQQNIKRRVYDALNVLIAVDLLKRDGRNVTTGKPKAKNIIARLSNVTEAEEAAGLAELVEKQEAKLQEKRRRLMETEKKLEAIRYLLAKNRATHAKNEEKVSFPFVGVSASSQLYIDHHSKSEITINTQQQLHPFGDIDSLQWLTGYSPKADYSFP